MSEVVHRTPLPPSLMGIDTYLQWERLALEIRVSAETTTVSILESITLDPTDEPKVHALWVYRNPPPPVVMVIEGYCMCGHPEEQHDRNGCQVGWTCFCGAFVQRDVPMPGPLKPDGSY